MKKIIALGIMLVFLGMTISSSTGFNLEKQSTVTTIDGNKLYVGGNGTGNYTKIQDAIDDASNGDTVYVYDDSSPYYENVEIMYKSINLIGEDKNTTVIDGNKSGYVVLSWDADWVNISGFTIQNSKVDYRHAGIRISSNYNTITGNIISNNDNGINLWHSSDYNTITGNIISNNWNGIELWESCNHNLIADNDISNNDARGVCIYSYSVNNTITGNNIVNNDWYGIVLGYSSFNTITGNYISSSNDAVGIDLYKTNSNNITGNTILNSLMGVYLGDSSDYNTITYNTISNSQCEGIYLSGFSNNITGNTISNNRNGIILYKANSSNISCNNIISNSNFGIRLVSYCFMNIISGNIISNNDDGIIVCDSNNTVYHNNFINNTQNANDTGDNIWDDGEYGNYWSDYEDKYPDAKPKILKPWMWNTPYEIEGGDNKDNCPLVNQWPKSKSKTIQKNIELNNPFINFLHSHPNMFSIIRQLLGI